MYFYKFVSNTKIESFLYGEHCIRTHCILSCHLHTSYTSDFFRYQGDRVYTVNNFELDYLQTNCLWFCSTKKPTKINIDLSLKTPGSQWQVYPRGKGILNLDTTVCTFLQNVTTYLTVDSWYLFWCVESSHITINTVPQAAPSPCSSTMINI